MAGPLTQEHKAEIDRQLAALKEADAEIKRAQLAGIDVAEQAQEVVRLRDQLTKIKAAYFPTGR